MKSRLEKESFKTLDKPESFAHAQEIEKETVLFAKEVFLYYSGAGYNSNTNSEYWWISSLFVSKHIIMVWHKVRKANKLLGTLSGRYKENQPIPSSKRW